MRSFFKLVRILLVLIPSMLSSCSSRTAVTVSMRYDRKDIPDLAAVRVFTTLNGTLANEPFTVTDVLPAEYGEGTGLVDFSVQIPEDSTGFLSFALGGFTSKGCLAALGSASLSVSPQDRRFAVDGFLYHPSQLQPGGYVFPGQTGMFIDLHHCTGPETTPLVVGVSDPVVTATGNTEHQVYVLGWGLLPGFEISTVGTPQKLPIEQDASSLYIRSVVLPIDATRSHYTPVTVRNPGVHSDRQDALLWVQGPSSFQVDAMHPGDYGPIAVDDLNRDGTLDVVKVGAQAFLFPGATSGPLGAPQPVAVGSADASTLLTGDFVGDGSRQLLVVRSDPSAALTMAKLQSGTWISQDISGGGFTPALSADFNHDGHPDLIFASGKALNVRMGMGQGQFAPAMVLSQLPFPIYELATADWNGDGNLDVAVLVSAAAPTNGALYLLSQRVDGTLSAPAPVGLPQLRVEQSVSALSAADMDQDGTSDLVVAIENVPLPLLSHGGILTYQLFRPGKTSIASLYANSTPRAPTRMPMAVGDLNGDGFPDAVMAAPLINRIFVFYNDHMGGYAQDLPVILPMDAHPPLGDVSTLRIADLNHDGKGDIVFGGAFLTPDPMIPWLFVLYNQSL